MALTATEKARRYRAAHPERVRAKKRAAYWANIEANRAKGRERSRQRWRDDPLKQRAVSNESKRRRRRADPQGKRAYDARVRHGLGIELWIAQRMQVQQGRCYGCGDELSSDPKKVCVDHDHSCCPAGRSCTYCRRGLTCCPCNMVIGMMKDDAQRIARLAANFAPVFAETRTRLAGKPVQEMLA